MPVVDCAFETDRLLADEWHSMPPQSWQRQDLDRVVSQMLTGSVTQPLPESWHGRYTLERTQLWIAERDAEGTDLLVVEKSSRKAIGLLFMAWFNVSDGVEIRVGYLLAEPFWGRGFASEMVAGLVAQCRLQPSVASLAGGVALDNPASARVLEKNGFRQSTSKDEVSEGEAIWRLWLRK